MPRERLFHRLDLALEGRAVWVGGPAGCGKTTLLSSYLAARGHFRLWYRLDEGDSDIASLFHHLRLAVANAGLPAGELPLLTPEYLLGAHTFARGYFDTLLRLIPRPAVLVFDNHEELRDDAPLIDLLRPALSTLPAGIGVVLLSRYGPPPALARLAASQSLEVLGWNDLRLTAEESRALVTAHPEWRLPATTTETLVRQTRGWAAGLILLARKMSRAGAGNATTDLLPTEEVFNHFANEIYAAADPRIRHFLLSTAFLPEMTAELAEQLIGEPAGKYLARLHRDHYFVEDHRASQGTYAYHPLFRSFLLTRAEEELEPATLRELRRRTALVLEASGETDLAADLLTQADAAEELAGLLDRQAPARLKEGRHRTVARWILALSEERRRASPPLLYWLAAATLPADPSGAREKFETVFQGCPLDAPLKFLAWAGIVDSFRNQWDDFTPLARWIEWLDATLATGVAIPSPQAETQVVTRMAAALMIVRPDHPDIAQWVERAVAAAREHPDIDQRIQAYSYLVMYFFWMGDLRTGGMLLEEIRQFARLPDASPVTRLVWNWLEAGIEIWMEAAFDAATAKIREALDLGAKSGVHIWNPMLWAMGTYGALAHEDVAEARGYIGHIAANLDHGRRHMLVQYHYLEGWCSLVEGDLQKARRHGEVALRVADETGYVFPRIVVLLGMVWILFERNEVRTVAPYLARAETLSERTGSRVFEYACLLARAEWLFRSDQHGEALAQLADAFRLGRAEGYYGLMWSAPWKVLRHLCAEALRHGIEPGYTRELIRRQRLAPPADMANEGDWPWPVRVHALGRFRLVVEGRERSASRKTRKKPLEILQVLIALGGRDVPAAKIADLLWPDVDGDMAQRSFATTLHRLRHMLGEKRSIRLRDGRASIDPRYCWVDVLAFQEALDAVDRASRSEPTRAASPKLARALELYRGDFLVGEQDKPWAAAARERLRRRCVTAVERWATRLDDEGRPGDAVTLLERAIEIDPLAGALHLRLMQALHRHGRSAEALDSYRHYRARLDAELGTAPDAEMQQTYRAILAAEGNRRP